MHLLTYDDSGRIIIESFFEKPVPRYAILSHTWGADNNEEVTFADITNGSGRAKRGYEKIRFCYEQTRTDKLKYFWIDTCCIDTSNKAEHSSSIRSMFRWYQNAEKWYVYLADVWSKKRRFEIEDQDCAWERSFKESRWFTRGWTLQELVAPKIVEFFSQEGDILGDKSQLKEMIYRLTNIPIRVLDGVPISRFEVNERRRWWNNRATKLPEDKAYALLGICGVEIEPVYGEGGEAAVQRLDREIEKRKACLRDLRVSDPRDDKERIEETKGGLLDESYVWVLSNDTFQSWQQDQSNLLWVKGDPGKGKTMLLCGIINKLQQSNTNTDTVVYFFCQATDPRLNHAAAVLRGLLYSLARQRPVLASHIQTQYDLAGKSLFEDANAWIALRRIFSDILQDPNLGTVHFIIDALDECINDCHKLVDFVTKQSSKSLHVKWIVSSRNLPEIGAQLDKVEQKAGLSLELNAGSVAHAVRCFIQNRVGLLAEEKKYTADLRSDVLKHLLSNSGDTFLWVALVCGDLMSTLPRHVKKKLERIPPGLNTLYQRMIDQIDQSHDAEVCRQILATTAIAYRPLTIAELAAMIEQLQGITEELEEIIKLCGSFLTVREDTVYLIHQSAKDFLLGQAFRTIFPQGTQDIHRSMCIRSAELLSKTLRRDVFDLVEPGFPIDDVQRPQPDPLVKAEYSCTYWVDHLCGSMSDMPSKHDDSQIERVVRDFIRQKYLYWLEALSLCRRLDQGIASMTKLCFLVEVGYHAMFAYKIDKPRT